MMDESSIPWACPLITYPLGFLRPGSTFYPLSHCSGEYALTLQQTMGEEFTQVSMHRGVPISTLPSEVSRNSLLEAKKLLIKWRSCCRSCKLDTYPRGHCWVAHLLQTTTRHERKPSPSYHEKDCSLGNPPCPLLIPCPFRSFCKAHLLQGLANKAQRARKMQWRLLLLLGSRGLQREAGAARSCTIPARFRETVVGADTPSAFGAHKTFLRSQPPKPAFMSKKHSRGSL